MLQPIPTRIYRITHLINLPDTLQHGLFCRNHPAPPGGPYRNIGDADLTSRRGSKAVTVAPGGVLNDYVPFYLGPRSPMLYRISRNAPQSDIVYLVSHVQRLQQLALPFVFTDGHAYEAFTSYYQDPAQLAGLAWDDIYAEQWKPTEQNPHRQRHKQAELLVHRAVPVNALLGIAVYDEHIRTQVEQIVQQAGLQLPVAVAKSWYY
ncbi:type II toxin-antitoxin system toxin DNA ADP-ribosyl transferase DarT [Hymenobacter pini]|uniref:type II toxin-antitoxin system toxin DNA ADP-ribosyl transferase DarT n=1 Tax=Hymenobacter pini TaxID=2880879 RepID=UPI001CF401AD|nr:DUF4433 domain-containing protein [Hymenobacter pini]MCA8831914.1 DUF4433 domain-containing protein [Hymenobacter pini]